MSENETEEAGVLAAMVRMVDKVESIQVDAWMYSAAA